MNIFFRFSQCQLVERRGYKCEIHRIQTSDGYILEMHRITGGPKSPPSKGKRVAYLQHGLLDSSATWVMMGVDNGLGIADEIHLILTFTWFTVNRLYSF